MYYSHFVDNPATDIFCYEATKTDAEFEPYTETTSTIPTTDGLAGIKVSSGGNYTDENGQQWICDEIVKYADGSGMFVQRIENELLTSSLDWQNSKSTVGRYLLEFPIKENVAPLCSHFIGETVNVTTQGIVFNNLGVQLCFNTEFETIEEWKSWIDSNNVHIVYAKAEPIITDLSAEEIAEIEKLYTFYPVTNISNDADCGMEITYISTLLEFIEPKTDWDSFSRFNIEDFNRIKNNLEYLHETALIRVGNIEIDDMGADLVVDSDEDKAWKVEVFNAFENNLHTISNKIINADIGSKKTFYENGLMPDFAELNRIESVMLRNKKALDNLSAGLRRIPFRFGQFKTRL